MKSEKGSITVLSFVTVMFILIILATLFYSAVEKSKSQVIEMEKLSNAYDGDMGEIYKERKGIEGIFATLYSDGSLVFTNRNRTLDGRTVITNYGEITTLANIPWDTNKTNITKVEFLDKIEPTSTANWFKDCNKLTTIINIANLDTRNVTDMSNMFYGCTGLTNLNLATFSTKKVTSLAGFLAGCTNLNSLDIRNFDPENVITYNEFIPKVKSTATITTNEKMATWLRANFTEVSGNIKVV